MNTAGTTENLEIISGEYLGFDSAGFTATIIFTILGLFAGLAVFLSTGNPFFSLMIAIVMLMPGIFIGGVSVGFLFSFISVGTVLGSWYWIKRSPE